MHEVRLTGSGAIYYAPPPNPLPRGGGGFFPPGRHLPVQRENRRHRGGISAGAADRPAANAVENAAVEEATSWVVPQRWKPGYTERRPTGSDLSGQASVARFPPRRGNFSIQKPRPGWAGIFIAIRRR